MYAYDPMQSSLTHLMLVFTLGETACACMSVFCLLYEFQGRNNMEGDISKLSPRIVSVLIANIIARVITNCLCISVNTQCSVVLGISM